MLEINSLIGLPCHSMLPLSLKFYDYPPLWLKIMLVVGKHAGNGGCKSSKISLAWQKTRKDSIFPPKTWKIYVKWKKWWIKVLCTSWWKCEFYVGRWWSSGLARSSRGAVTTPTFSCTVVFPTFFYNFQKVISENEIQFFSKLDLSFLYFHSSLHFVA